MVRQSAPTRPPAKRSRPSAGTRGSDIEERLLNVLQNVPKPETEVDECYHFLVSLTPRLVQLDPHTRREVKKKNAGHCGWCGDTYRTSTTIYITVISTRHCQSLSAHLSSSTMARPVIIYILYSIVCVCVL